MANNGLKLTIFFLFIITYEYWASRDVIYTSSSSSSSSSSPHDVFILAGQSNMAGRGGVVEGSWDEITPLEVKPQPGKILRLSGGLNWEDAKEPLHGDIDVNKTCGVGPGMAFANALLRGDPSRFKVVGLVPCAIGGSGIHEWLRGGRLYDMLVKRAMVTVEGGGEICAVLWFQGERDTLNITDAQSYKGKLEKLLVDLRTDLKSPLLPIIQFDTPKYLVGGLFGQWFIQSNSRVNVFFIGPKVALASGEGPYIETVREAQHGIGLPNVMTVDAMGLQLQPDGLHLSTQAQVQVGEMLAYAILRSNCSR